MITPDACHVGELAPLRWPFVATRDDPSHPPDASRTGPPAPDGSGAEIPGVGRRLGALLVDWLICVLVSAVFVDPRTSGWPPVAVLLVEQALFVGVLGQTPGMLVTRLRCISVVDGGPIGVPRAVLRGVLLILIVPAAIMDAWRRGLHDRAAGSIVVVAPPRADR